MADEDSLEDMVKKLSRNLPKFIDLRTFEHNTLRIIRSKYKPGAEYTSIGGHSKRRFVEFTGEAGKSCTLHPCVKQKGSESVISTGVFNSEITKFAEATGIPQTYLAAYIKGSGNLYKKFVKRLEEEYGI
ncbi:MAG: hypothetical protein QW666_01510 [Candidatus Woesearchaeota archaeon]